MQLNAVWLPSLIVLALVGCSRAPVVPPEEPAVHLSDLSLKFPDCNVVFVSFDALQGGHVGCQGYFRDVTPTIDRLAGEGIRFARNYSVSSWTVPASMSWFTGVYPSEHRMTNKYAVYAPPVTRMSNLKELSPDLVTLADVFRANGYATGGFTGNAGVSGGFGYEQGFDVYYYPKNVFGSMDESIPRALEWVKANRERKFFLFLHGYDVHGQSTPSQGYDYRFVDPDYDRRYTGSEQEQEALREEGLDRGQVNLREADVRFWRAVYDEKIQRTDEKFRDFLKEYQKIIPPGKTLFVLTSDHGTEFHEHRRFDHGFTLYNELLHVPLILRLPRRVHPLVVDDRISSIDVMPTILDLVGLPMPGAAAEQLRGKSLVPSFQGQSVARDVFSETDYRQYTYKRSIVAPDGWKLIYTLETRTRELYDLNTDPAEQKDLAAAQPRKAEELERRLFAHFRTLGHDLTAKRWETGLNPVYNSQAKDPPKK